MPWRCPERFSVSDISGDYNQGIFRSGHLVLTGTGSHHRAGLYCAKPSRGNQSRNHGAAQIDKSIEESAYDLGADSGTVFTTVTLPLIKDSFFSGLVTAFVRSMTATSAVIFLVSPSFQLITPQIMAQAEIGRYGEACAYATILIAIVYAAILFMNIGLKYFGSSRKVRGTD